MIAEDARQAKIREKEAAEAKALAEARAKEEAKKAEEERKRQEAIAAKEAAARAAYIAGVEPVFEHEAEPEVKPKEETKA